MLAVGLPSGLSLGLGGGAEASLTGLSNNSGGGGGGVGEPSSPGSSDSSDEDSASGGKRILSYHSLIAHACIFLSRHGMAVPIDNSNVSCAGGSLRFALLYFCWKQWWRLTRRRNC